MKINKELLVLLALCTPCFAQQFTPAEQNLPEYKAAVERATKTGKMARMRLPDAVSKSAIKACTDAWAPYLNDPRSTYEVGAYLSVKVNGETKPPKIFKQIVIDARSKNGFGGQVPVVLLCDFKTPVVIDSKSAEGFALLKRLNGEEDFMKNYVE